MDRLLGTIETGLLRGTIGMRIDRIAIDEEKRIVPVAFSSEFPVSRWFGTEILDHRPKSVRMGFIKSGAPVLHMHNMYEQIGVVEDAWIDKDRVGRAALRFSMSKTADEIYQDILDDIRRWISVGYYIWKMRLESEDKESGERVYRATDWEPKEISSVPIPADPDVGVGRAAVDVPDAHNVSHRTTVFVQGGIDIMTEAERLALEAKRKAAALLIEAPPEDGQRDAGIVTPPAQIVEPEPVRAPVQPEQRVDVQAVNDAAEKRVMQRVQTILEMGSKCEMSDLAQKAIADGVEINEFRMQILEKMSERNGRPVRPADDSDPNDIGMDSNDMRKYSVVRAIRALAQPNNRKLQDEATLEFEASEAVSQRLEREPEGFFVPQDVQKEWLPRDYAPQRNGQRDLNIGEAAAGGYLVDTTMQGMVELLRNKAIVMQLATVLDGLVGDVTFPKQTGAATAYWVGEDGDVTESQQTLGQIQMNPKTVGGYTEYTRKMLKQASMGVEMFVRNDLTSVVGLGIDLAAFHAPGGSAQPTGILATTGIGAVVGGTNGLAPTWAHIIKLETEISQDNADVGRLAYVTNSKVRGQLKATVKIADVRGPVWDEGKTPLNGYAAHVTNQISSTLTKGNQSLSSAIIFGNWADFFIGLWGTLDILVNPFANQKSGRVGVSAHQDVDMAVRHAQSFSAMQDALTP